MNKKHCIMELNRELRFALRAHHAAAGISQEALAESMQITPRACSGLENGEYGFSVFSMMALFAVMPERERLRLFGRLCAMMIRMLSEAA